MLLDTELLELWRAGDKSAGEELLSRYFDPLCRFFRSKLSGEVDDLIQRTFMACVEGRDRVEQGGFRAYLFAVARNRLHDHLRSAYRERNVQDLSGMSLADLGTTPSQHVARAREHQLLVDALHRIALDHRIALEMAYWEGMKGPEIATVLGISANTVRSRLARARQELREQLVSMRAEPAMIEDTLDRIDRAVGA